MHQPLQHAAAPATVSTKLQVMADRLTQLSLCERRVGRLDNRLCPADKWHYVWLNYHELGIRGAGGAFRATLLFLRPRRGWGILKWALSVCPSVDMSRTKRSRIGRKVAHPTSNNLHQSKGQRLKVKVCRLCRLGMSRMSTNFCIPCRPH